MFTGEDIKDGQNVWQSHGRPGGRLASGATALRRAGLDGRLAAPRGGLLLDHWAERERGSRYADARRRAAGGPAGAAARRSCAPTPTTRPRATSIVSTASAPRRSRPSRRTTPTSSATIRAGRAARRLRDPGERAHGPRSAAGDRTPSSSGPPGPASTNRPGDDDHLHAATGRTSRWSATCRPATIVVWTVVSFVLLLAGIGALAWYFAVQRRKRGGRASDAAGARPAAGARADALEAGDAQVLLGRGGADPRADRPGRRRPRTTASRARASTASRWPSGCPTR